jgi:hypothetical protein
MKLFLAVMHKKPFRNGKQKMLSGPDSIFRH